MHKKKVKTMPVTVDFLSSTDYLGSGNFETEFRYSFEAYLEHILYTRLAFNS